MVFKIESLYNILINQELNSERIQKLIYSRKNK